MATISRRKFLTIAGLSSLPVLAGIDARLIEPKRLQVRQLQHAPNGDCRFVQLSDLHYRGDEAYATEVVQTINALQPEFVCFTGDLIEDTKYLGEALNYIRQIKVPVYGSPGNHDYWSHAPFPEFVKAFRETGGAGDTDECRQRIEQIGKEDRHDR